MQVRQEDVERPLAGRIEREPEAADDGARVEHERSSILERDLDTRRVAAVAHRLGARRRNRSARSPDLDLHGAAVSATQKNTIAPCEPSAPIIGTALTSTKCSAPLIDRIRWRACPGRFVRSAAVSGCFSI